MDNLNKKDSMYGKVNFVQYRLCGRIRNSFALVSRTKKHCRTCKGTL